MSDVIPTTCLNCGREEMLAPNSVCPGCGAAGAIPSEERAFRGKPLVFTPIEERLEKLRSRFLPVSQTIPVRPPRTEKARQQKMRQKMAIIRKLSAQGCSVPEIELALTKAGLRTGRRRIRELKNQKHP